MKSKRKERKMLVCHKNELWDLNIPLILFESFKRDNQSRPVEILEHNSSSYKKKQRVDVRDVEDYSYVRNMVALGKM